MSKSSSIKTKQKSTEKNSKKSKSALIYLVGAIVVLIILFVGLKVYNTYPQASFDEVKAVTLTHQKELNVLNAELVDNYKISMESKDIEAWKTFSQSWISKIGISKPNLYALRLSNRSMELVNAANYISRDLFQLWTEYNVAIESGTPVDIAVEKKLLDSIASGLSYIDSIVSK